MNELWSVLRSDPRDGPPVCGEDLDGFYQIIALKTHLTPKLYFNTGYQFRKFKNPDHLLIGLGWRFGY